MPSTKYLHNILIIPSKILTNILLDLLRGIFDRFDPKQTGSVSRAQVLVALKNEESLLLEKFPKHVTEIPRSLENMDCKGKNGKLTWEAFSSGLMEVLSKPGGL